MSDNSTLPVAGGGTEVFANDDISSVKYPRVKAGWGPDGTFNETDVASGKPFPVQVRESDGTATVSPTLGSGVMSGSVPVTIATDDTVLAAAAASLSVMDDWDESDRAKVNLIAGQAGVAGNTGTVSALTQRVTLATDDTVSTVLGTTAGAAVVTDATGSMQQYLRGLVKRWVDALGAGTAAAALRTTLASDDPAVATLGATGDSAATQGSTGSISAKLRTVTAQLNTLAGYLDGVETQLDTLHTDSANFIAGEYETVAASATDQILGPTGAVGDYLEAVLIVPGTTAAGAVSIKDGNGSSISVFAGGGTTALADLAPIYVPLGIKCVNATTAGWKVTTGTNVTAIGIGNFT